MSPLHPQVHLHLGRFSTTEGTARGPPANVASVQAIGSTAPSGFVPNLLYARISIFAYPSEYTVWGVGRRGHSRQSLLAKSLQARTMMPNVP
jgi:hypothetical protein